MVNLTISLSDHLIPFAQWESHHLTLWSSYSLHTVVISPSHSLIILFPSHSGNLTISLSDHLIPCHAVGISPWSESDHGDYHCRTVESHHLTLWSSYLPFAQWESHHLTLWSSYSLRTVGISPSHSLIILFPSHSGNLTISIWWSSYSLRTVESHHLTLWSSYYPSQWNNLTISRSLIILFPSHSGNLTISEWSS